jgi:hypothetical protein
VAHRSTGTVEKALEKHWYLFPHNTSEKNQEQSTTTNSSILSKARLYHQKETGARSVLVFFPTMFWEQAVMIPDTCLESSLEIGLRWLEIDLQWVIQQVPPCSINLVIDSQKVAKALTLPLR